MLTDSVQSPKVYVPQPHKILAVDALKILNTRSNAAGFARFSVHLAVLGVSGCIWGSASGWLKLTALLVYGIGLAMMFCPTHECVHRTAFANAKANDVVAWWAGLLSFYNSTFYRYYHKWHHRYTQIAGKDPELDDPKPENWGQYLWRISGIPWWYGKVLGHVKISLGQVENRYYLPESSYGDVIRSTRLQLGAYGMIGLVTAALGHPWFIVTYWLLPLAIGQPFLRFVLIAEHTGCSDDNNPLTNTRTTLTLWPVRFLMWNMPYHAEHHMYPSIPFHALPTAHQSLKEYLGQVDRGYVGVNQDIVARFE
ncbi:fatty acid desaturase [Leptolyngbya sp. Heron Island J]|uniref:fatty acid desaturase n=1 Tax=Leptolyngbya sp. Heron Island J TaxID=1385935 RepID=UPI0003B97E25|nr:fatty acid desaturase [Leptolyngbya sp. Heron Island J]ESA35705.1 fatty acid desaturase [Leptolyngbya sp. Heron Island J]